MNKKLYQVLFDLDDDKNVEFYVSSRADFCSVCNDIYKLFKDLYKHNELVILKAVILVSDDHFDL